MLTPELNYGRLTRVNTPSAPICENAKKSPRPRSRGYASIEPMRLIGTTKAAELLGITKQRVSQLRQAGLFPEPDGWIDDTPGWKPETIELWQESRYLATGE